jgi:ATP-binding cassette subfamily F protein 2
LSLEDLHPALPPRSDLTALEAVMEVDSEKKRLEEEAEYLASLEMTDEIEHRLTDV